MQIEKYNTVDT